MQETQQDAPVQQPELSEAQQSFQTAVEAFYELNRVLPAGIGGFQLPLEQIEQSASVDALATLLIELGVITDQQFIDAKVSRMTEIVENLTINAHQIKRKALGAALTNGVHLG